MTDEQKNTTHLLIWLLAVLLIMAAAFAISLSTADAQNRPGLVPDYRDWGPDEQRRRMPPMPRFEERPRYDDQDQYGRGRPLPREQYEQRSFCTMHPRACQ